MNNFSLHEKPDQVISFTSFTSITYKGARNKTRNVISTM